LSPLLLASLVHAAPLPPADAIVWVGADGACSLTAGTATAASGAKLPADALGAALAARPHARVRVSLDRAAPVALWNPLRAAIWEDAQAEYVDLVVKPGDGISMGYALSSFSSDPDAPPVPPLVLTLRPDAVEGGRLVQAMVSVEASTPQGRLDAVRAILSLDRYQMPQERGLVLSVDDGLRAGELVDLLVAIAPFGLGAPVVVAGPSPAREPVVAPARPKARPVVPKAVEARPSRLVIDGKDVYLDTFLWIAEDCDRDPCVVAAVPEEGAPIVLGARSRGADAPLDGWLLGLRVWPMPGYTARVKTLPTWTGPALGPALGVAGIPPVRPGDFADVSAAAAPRSAGMGGAIGGAFDGFRGATGDGFEPPDGPPKVIILGAIDRDLVELTFALGRKVFDGCLAGKPANGTVTVKVIVAEGNVSGASIKNSTLGNAAAEACLTTAVGALSFPGATGTSVVTYPIMFY
jgi:hypothetical protein